MVSVLSIKSIESLRFGIAIDSAPGISKALVDIQPATLPPVYQELWRLLAACSPTAGERRVS